MDQIKWASAYEPVPQALEYRVRHTLEHLESAPQRAGKRPLRTAAITLALLLALGGVAYAVYESITADIFGWFYGGRWKEELQNGDFAPMGQSIRLGDVTYTVEEMVYKTEGEYQGLYGVVRIAPAEGANVVIMPDDLSVNDPAGYLLHYPNAGQTMDGVDPSYAELAKERGAKLLVVRAAVNSISADGVAYCDCFGESWLPQTDGTLLGTIEISDDLPRADSYELNLWVSNWETTPEGIWLRDEPDSTWLKQDWIVTVTPETKGE
jgi:hypothetical protein